MGYSWKFQAGVTGDIKKLKYSKIFLFLFLSVVFSSCAKKNTDSAGYTASFKPVFDSVTHYYDLNQPEKAISYLDSNFPLLNDPSVNDKFRFYAFHYVYWQKAKRDYKKALPYADSMLVMAHKSVVKEQYAANFAEANYAKGDTYFSLNQYNDAYQCYFQGYLMGKNYLNQASAADYTYRMGMIMFKQGHYKLAAGYFKESYAKSLLVKDDHGFVWFYRRQELLDNIGESYTHSGDIDSAITYFDNALKYVNANDGKFKVKSQYIDIARGVIYNNKAQALIALKKYDEAEQLLKKSIAINIQKGGDNGDAELAQLKLAQIYLIKGESGLLRSLLSDLRKQLDVIKNDNAEADWNRLMGSYYLKKNDLAKAIVYTQNYNALKDSTIKRLTLLKESDVNQQLANLEKQYQIENLNDNNKMQSIYLNVAIVCAVLLLAIAFLVWRNWRQSKFDVAVVIMLNKQINQQKAELERALDEVKFSSREKDRILRAVAHDLRNPLGGIASLTSVMAEESEHDKDLQSQLILIKQTAADTLELINEILEATNNSSSALKRQSVDVNALIANSVELLRFKAAEKHQQIVLEGLDHPVELDINREKIWRVISNLISNAIKFSPVDAMIKVKAVQKTDSVIISINDHGIGIPDNMKDKVFNMFTDAKRSGTMGEKSFGLGLSISRQIVEKHQGEIWFESEPKKGTTFYVSLPRSVKQDAGHDQLPAGKELARH
ncbi:tetratricopeptide repeat-containing sensor histidine kinase [Mucilaginibacter ginsenosidivorans]|nr:ATP-binding protein [Mucilaginibacter ginsenosidivorans]